VAEIVIVVDLPIPSASAVDTTELALLLRDVKAAQIIDYTDADSLTMTMNERQELTEPMYREDVNIPWQQF
jgi:hypothetical protein